MRLSDNVAKEDGWMWVCIAQNTRNSFSLELSIQLIFELAIVGDDNMRGHTPDIQHSMNGWS
jgi:hypothetical protein